MTLLGRIAVLGGENKKKSNSVCVADRLLHELD